MKFREVMNIMNVTTTKLGYKIEGYPLDKTQFAVLQASGDVWFVSLSAGELWENCSCGQEPVCVSCFKCSSHCKCGASFWTITPVGMSKAMSFGLDVIVDGIKLQGTDHIEVLLANAKAKSEQEQKERVEKERMAREANATLEKSRKEKVVSWELGKIALKIPDSEITFDVVDSVVDGYSTVKLIRFVSPKELACMEGVKSEYRGYDTDYSSFLAPKEIADRLNAPLLDAEWIKRKSEILTEPTSRDVENALVTLGKAGYKSNFNSSGELEFFSDQNNCIAVTNRWVETQIELATNGVRRSPGMVESRGTQGKFFNEDYGRKSWQQLVAEALGVRDKIETTWELNKPLIESRRAEEVRHKEEERKQNELKRAEELKEYKRKAEAERLAKREVIRQRIVRECDGKKKVELLSIYSYLKQSYTRERMIEAIIDHEMNPISEKSKKGNYNDGDAGIDY